MPDDRPGHLSPELMEQFLGPGLPESEAVSLAGHLRECSECRCRLELHQFWSEFGPKPDGD